MKNTECLLIPGDSAFRALEFSLLASTAPADVPNYRTLRTVIRQSKAGDQRKARWLLHRLVALSEGLVSFLKQSAQSVRCGFDGSITSMQSGRKAHKFMRRCRRFMDHIRKHLVEFDDAIPKPSWFKWNLRKIPVFKFSLTLAFSFGRLSMSPA